MPDAKITALTAISVIDVAADMLPIVDISDTSMAASGTTKKITINQILGASGAATFASATITGNLTVDTNTLFVDSTNNRVGIGTVTPSQRFSIERTGVGSETSVLISRSSTNYLDEQAIVWRSNDLSNLDYAGIYAAVDGADAGSLSFRTTSLSTLTNRYRIASDGVATWSNVGGVAGTAMTLNAAGLGVGVVATLEKLQVNGGIVLSPPTTPATLGTNGQLTVNATSNTNLRFSYRGSDGTTRVANITLA